MLKQFSFSVLMIVSLTACDPSTMTQVLDTVLQDGAKLTNGEISGGLKEALQIGIGKGSDLLSREDGYFKSAYKILLPEEARAVTDKLQNVPGFSQVEDIILEKINRGAEDAAKAAKPIFVNAIRSMTINDALGILKGNKDAATTYLRGATYQQLYDEFNPVIANSLDKFKAREYWSDAVNAYQRIPFIQKEDVPADLGDYVTQQALVGLFDMVAKEELNIRDNISARTTDLLRKVFAAQD